MNFLAKLYLPLMGFWKLLLVGLGLSVLASMVAAYLTSTVNLEQLKTKLSFVYHYGKPGVFIAITLFLVTFASRISFLIVIKCKEFKIMKPAHKLHPTDLGFLVLNPGMSPDVMLHPFYSSVYIERDIVPFDAVEGATSPQVKCELDLINCLKNGKGFVLLGEPLAGKTHTIYEVVKKMKGYTVLKPWWDKVVPQDDAFTLVDRKKVILLLDDLNEYASSNCLDLRLLTERLSQHASVFVVAATCREGPEINVVREAIENPIRRFYEDIPLKISLVPLKNVQKEALAKAVSFSGKRWDPSTADLFPTPGSITMAEPLSSMRIRFQQLTPERKDILRSIKLLASAGILPITQRRLQMVIKGIFNRELILLDHLDDLKARAFLNLASESDIVIHKPAYILNVVEFIAGKTSDNYYHNLKSLLLKYKDYDGLSYLGFTYSLRNEYHNALDCFAKAIVLAPHEPGLTYNKGVTLAKLDNYPAALECFRETVRIEPMNLPQAWYNMGWVLFQMEKYEEALSAFEKALLCQQRDAKTLHMKGTTLAKMKRHEEALKIMDEALQLDPHCAEVWHDKSFVLAELHSYMAALENVNKALELKYNYPEAWIDKSACLIALEKPEEALDALEEVLRIKPNYPTAFFRKGIILQALSRWEDALKAYERAISQGFHDFNVWFGKGFVLIQLDRYDEALDAFIQALQLEPRNSESWRLKGYVLIQLRRFPEALVALENALEIMPDNLEAFIDKGVAFNQLGQDREAFYWLCKAWRSREQLSDHGARVQEMLTYLGHNTEDCNNAFFC